MKKICRCLDLTAQEILDSGVSTLAGFRTLGGYRSRCGSCAPNVVALLAGVAREDGRSPCKGEPVGSTPITGSMCP